MQNLIARLQALIAPIVAQMLPSIVEQFKPDIARIAAAGPYYATLALGWILGVFTLTGVATWFCVRSGELWTLPAFVLPLALALLLFRPKFPPLA